MRKMLALAMLPLVAGCVGSPSIYAPTSACSTLIPETWVDGVKLAAPAPVDESMTADDIAKLWQQFGIDQTVVAITGNERFAAGVGIIRRCEKRDAEAVQKSRPKFMGVF